MISADTIFLGGRIITVDPDFRIADAVAVADRRIIAVGTESEVRTLCSPSTRVIDLAGRTLLPGFVEAHGHPTAEMNMLGPDTVDIRASECPTAADVFARLRDAVALAAPEDWVIAFGWDPLLVPDLPEMSGRLLTELSPEIPVSVMHYSAHSSWANDAALARLGLDRNSPDPVGSAFIRSADGELTGEGREVPASMILMGPTMQARPDSFGGFLHHELHRFAAAGITTTGDLAFEATHYDAVADYMAGHDSPVRIRAYERSGAGPHIAPAAAGDSMFRKVGVKVWKDGSPWIGNIHTSFGYEDSAATRAVGVHPGHRGCSNYTAEDLLEICRTHVGDGWQIACHVHGDLAIDTVLDTFEQVMGETGRTDLRLRLEHCGAITAAQVRRAHALGVTISFFVAHIHFYGDVLRGLFGDRADEWTPAGVAAECGMPFSLHNDSPVTPANPLLNMRTAMTRQSRSGAVLGDHLRIDIRDAIRAQTIWPAWQLHSEHEIGSIETGKFADFVILDGDPLTTDPAELDAIGVVETWIAGRRVDAVHDVAGIGP
ncbi:amidohydrolase [Gordonia rhizosphera]|uniref:Amidohydrolase 3 domain-containing protein n=1 Tax=Gordonia rhizosphera NBRC 16068 TaxID=1108045 RepID=K6W1P0_9ACTN|nr:amidohydrolase [Gordonia rhizosphera]GAB93085.1 hypothetical protein GORHZ_205_00270 [Gordonia rhizosphera NBRC 16068]